MHFSPRRRKTEPPVRHGDVEKQPEAAMRWLGLCLNRKLTFKTHVEKWTAKAQTVAHHLRSLGNTRRGALPSAVQRAVRACVEPILLFGVEAWYPGTTSPRWRRPSKEGPSRVQQLARKMSKALKQAIRAILPTWKTTPIAVLHRESGIPPVHQLLEARRLRFSARIKSLDYAHPLAKRTAEGTMHILWPNAAPRLRLGPSSSAFPTRLRRTNKLLANCQRPVLVPRKYRSETPQPLQTASKEDSAKHFLDWLQSIPPSTLIVYSDGSLSPTGAAGYGFTVHQNGHSIRHGAGRLGPAEGCLTVGHHPGVFREAEVVMIPKPGKRNLSTPRAWRPISLLSCLGKGLERLIARRLAWASIHYAVLHPQQAGALPKRSAVDPVAPKRSAVDLVAALIHDIEEAFARGEVATLVTADIQGALDTAMCNRLVLRLREQGWPDNLARWAGSFMSGRSARVRYQDITTPTTPLQCGLPQGYDTIAVRPSTGIARVSDLVFALHRTDLSVRQSRRTVRSPEETSRTASEYLQELVNWGAANSISFDPEKTEVMHFSRRRRETEPPVCHGDMEKQPEAAMRWLGLWLDRKFTFKTHVEKWAAKAQAVAHHLRSLGNTRRGAMPSAVQRAVRACVEPILLFGVEAWSTRPSPTFPPGAMTDTSATRGGFVACDRSANHSDMVALRGSCNDTIWNLTFCWIDLVLDVPDWAVVLDIPHWAGVPSSARLVVSSTLLACYNAMKRDLRTVTAAADAVVVDADADADAVAVADDVADDIAAAVDNNSNDSDNVIIISDNNDGDGDDNDDDSGSGSDMESQHRQDKHATP
ncbi:Reverse transcriptase [Metarhizium robertsii ARSEF 23]|uniref:Reverse transcriptase n=1 Tax=Metarhizium robertsii (strain ARSEF 23 / ATCC MYA-3075) TaxID=655844 RepID=E9ENK4_METRA|nr:Reverse transcriptase [Metarhizium robertsii ARSEF 23]EFZ04216.2 Reverse transcriptase [Metarhizium robertsii ARSEF 23]